MRVPFIAILTILFTFSVHAQLVLSNTFQGDVVGIGFGHGGNGQSDTVIINYPFDCSQCLDSIKIYLVADEFMSGHTTVIDLPDYHILINSTQVNFSSSTRIGNTKYAGANQAFSILHFNQAKISNTSNIVNFVIPPQSQFHAVSGFYLVMECKKNTSLNSNYIFSINSESFNGDFIKSPINPILLNPIDVAQNVGFAIVGNTFNYLNGDAQSIYFNNTFLGNIAGPDQISSSYFASGTNGHFYYENGILHGLDDDIEDLQMVGTDALANVQSIFNNQNSFFFSSIPEDANNTTNFTQAIVLSYTSNCPEFAYSVSNDTTICPNQPLQLAATGGVNYEWLPTTGLSCSTCANPVFSGDSSQLYTVRIWGNDSCSVVRPVMVHVREKPVTNAFSNAPSICGDNTGSVNLSLVGNNAGDTFTLDNGATQNTGYFPSLQAGTHTLTVHDSYGCAFDTLLTIDSYTTVNAAFNASPTSGAAPLQVQLTNQSNNETALVWSVDGVIQSNPFNTFTATDTGTFIIQLIAYQNDPSCADTAWTTIVVYDSLIINIPNVFTPNQDGINDFFGINTNANVQLNGFIVNRWGQTIASWSNLVSQLGFTSLWDGKIGNDAASEGVYFYQLAWKTETDEGKFEGYITLEK